MGKNITRIMPAADGWRAALYTVDHDGGAAYQVWAEPLIGWALTDDDLGGAGVRGVIVDPEERTYTIVCEWVHVETHDYDRKIYFAGYVRPGEDMDEMRSVAEESAASLARRRRGED